MGKNMAMASFYGLMARATMANSTTIRSVAREPTHGLIEGPIRVLGRIIKWTESVYSHGQMADNTLVSTRMIISTGMVFLSGRMEKGTRANGAKATSMEKGSARCQTEAKFKDSGRKVRNSVKGDPEGLPI